MNLNEKITNVKEILKDKKVIIAFSGGADSTLIAYLASKVSKNPIAVTVNNNLMPTDFVKNSEKIAESFRIKHLVIDIDFYKFDDFCKNKSNRCFICRDLMYKRIKEIASEKGYDLIIDGTNISDLLEDRPGILINYKNNILSPFVKGKLTSNEIHEYLDKENIYYSKSTTCIGTRIATNTQITPEKVDKIRYCEDFIYRNTDCKIVKLRDLNSYAICEVDNIESLLDMNKLKPIEDELKSVGFEKVALNLSSIKENHEIVLDYNKSNFQYNLPYKIDIQNTEKEFKHQVVSTTENQMKLKNNITIFKDGNIKGNDFKNKEEAMKEFIKMLPYLRREI